MALITTRFDTPDNRARTAAGKLTIRIAPATISHLRAGFGLAFVAAKPGCGVLTHTHDTVETFRVMQQSPGIVFDEQTAPSAIS